AGSSSGSAEPTGAGSEQGAGGRERERRDWDSLSRAPDAVDGDRRAGEADAGRGADAAVHRPASARSAARGPSLAARHPRHRPRAHAEPGRPAVKRLWKLPPPWTPRTRPPRLGNPQNGFHELPQAVSL